MNLFLTGALAIGVVLGAFLLIMIFSLLSLAQKGDAPLENMARSQGSLPPSTDTPRLSEDLLVDAEAVASPSEPGPKVLAN